MLSGKRIILGVTGGIAAYKAAILLRALQKSGAEVRVTMTPAATRFVGIDTFAALSRHEVAIEIFTEKNTHPDSWTRHITWGEWADLFIIAPCTANTLAKIAHGISDNMLTSTVLAARGPLLICPTMDGEMYQAPSTQRNLKTVQSFDYHVLEPEEGYLASALEGKGRLPDANAILKRSRKILSDKEGPLHGKEVLVTAGPTREHIDPVRFISNPSSGKMGFAMAEAAQALGANVTLIHGPVHLKKPNSIEAIEVESTNELFEQAKNHSNADFIIMAAAVSDFTPAAYHQQKIKKNNENSSLALKRTPDILAWLGEHKKEAQTLIGFAMETENLLENARKKLTEKNLDWIIANSLNNPEAGFAVDTNHVQVLSKTHQLEFRGTKQEIARQILSAILS